jgi:hypothetical protein
VSCPKNATRWSATLHLSCGGRWTCTFIPLCRSTLSMMTLAIAPQFPLHSRPDENILRVCSILRPAIFDPTSLEKNRRCAQLCKKYALATLRRDRYPLSSPTRTSVIDLMLTDEQLSTLVIVELKWVRKTLEPVEMTDRDAEILKGIRTHSRATRETAPSCTQSERFSSQT